MTVFTSQAEDGGYGGLSSSFSEKSIRLGFIRKVYAILSVQLIVTMAIVGVFTLDSVKQFSAENSWLWILALVIMIVSLITLACCEGVRRKTPHNFIFLGLFTLAEGFMLGTITARYSADEVRESDDGTDDTNHDVEGDDGCRGVRRHHAGPHGVRLPDQDRLHRYGRLPPGRPHLLHHLRSDRGFLPRQQDRQTGLRQHRLYHLQVILLIINALIIN